jgi:hypothetical protein
VHTYNCRSCGAVTGSPVLWGWSFTRWCCRWCCCPRRCCQLALAKPAGLQVLPKASFCQRTVLGLLAAYQQQVHSKRYPGSQQPVPVHRLGRGTSGEPCEP